MDMRLKSLIFPNVFCKRNLRSYYKFQLHNFNFDSRCLISLTLVNLFQTKVLNNHLSLIMLQIAVAVLFIFIDFLPKQLLFIQSIFSNHQKYSINILRMMAMFGTKFQSGILIELSENIR